MAQSGAGSTGGVQLPAGMYKPPPVVRGEHLLIVWDIENVRMPDEIEPAELMG